MKKYKMISLEYTFNCFKKPYCSFCYLKRERILDKLDPVQNSGMFSSYMLLAKEIVFLIKNTNQIAIAYNGLEIFNFLKLISTIRLEAPNVLINVTTAPRFVTPQMVGLWKREKISMVALSLDFEKCDHKLKGWIRAAKLLKEKKIKVGANILMLDSMWCQINQILKTISSYCRQIHLLRPKFYKTKVPKVKRKRLIFMLKQIYKSRLFIDQCFNFELLGVPCTRGKDFKAVHPNGRITPCSYELSEKPVKKLKKCPFI